MSTVSKQKAAMQIIFWDKLKPGPVATYTLPWLKEFRLGRHAENEISFDHPDLPLFYGTLITDEESLFLELVPGNVPWKGLTSRFFSRRKQQNQKTQRRYVLDKRRYTCNELCLQVLAPYEIVRPAWRALAAAKGLNLALPQAKPTG